MANLSSSDIVTTQYLRPNSITMSAASIESLGVGCGRSILNSAFASAVWPASNRAILIPFTIALPFTIASFFVHNGSAVSGNFDVGVYDDGQGTSTVNRLVSTGSTAQSGTSAPQSVAAAYTLVPGSYYLALCVDNTTATVFSKAPAQAAHLAAQGLAQVANGAVTLGSTLALALVSSAYLPLFGISQKASI